MADDFRYDVFLSHSAKDKAVVRDWLREATDGGKKQVRQIEFEGERFDVMSVRRWRERALRGG